MKPNARRTRTRFVYLAAAISALGGMLFGYDIGVISGAILFIKKDFSLSSSMEEIVVSSVLLGSLAGAAAGGMLADRLGRRKLLIVTAIVFGLGAIGAALAPEHGMADCRPSRCRRRHRRRFVCRAALHFRDCPGRYPRKAGFDQSSRPHQRHSHLLFDRLCLCRVAGVALDVRDGGDPGGRIWNWAHLHSRQPAMAGRPRTLGPGPGRAETDPARRQSGRRNQRYSAKRSPAEGELVGAAQSAPATGDDRGRWTGHRAANHRHQHGHLLRPDYFQVRRLIFLVGGDSGQRRSRSRQRHLHTWSPCN